MPVNDTISALLGVVGLLVFWRWFYQPLVLDYFRQLAFEARDEMFAEATSGELLSFEDMEYKCVRNTANSLIAYAEHASLSSFLFIIWHVPESRQSAGHSSIISQILKRETESQKAYARYLDRISACFVAFTIARSLPLLLLASITALLVLVLGLLTSLFGGLNFFRDKSEIMTEVSERVVGVVERENELSLGFT